MHTKRGTEAMDAMNIFTPYICTPVHDFWKSYFDYDCNIGICNSHLVGELTFVHEQHHQRWAKDLINQAERHLPMAKQKQKISGTFRGILGGEIFCRLRGYVSTARKNGLFAFDAVVRAFDGITFVPSIIYTDYLLFFFDFDSLNLLQGLIPNILS